MALCYLRFSGFRNRRPRLNASIVHPQRSLLYMCCGWATGRWLIRSFVRVLLHKGSALFYKGISHDKMTERHASKLHGQLGRNDLAIAPRLRRNRV